MDIKIKKMICRLNKLNKLNKYNKFTNDKKHVINIKKSQ